MSGIPEENFYRVAHLILDEIPNQLRNYFKSLWNNRYPSTRWDDTNTSGQLFLPGRNITNREILSKIQDGNTNEWDGTTLFAVLLFSSYNFFRADPNARVCIDRLRKLRNESYAHLDSTKIDDPAYNNIFKDAKNVFKQMGWQSNGIILIEARVLNTHDFQRLKTDMQQERARNRQLEIELNLVKEDVRQVKEQAEKAEDSIEKVKTEVLLTKKITGKT